MRLRYILVTYLGGCYPLPQSERQLTLLLRCLLVFGHYKHPVAEAAGELV
jgi:hypothetical protein